MTETLSTMSCLVCGVEVSCWDYFESGEHIREKVGCPTGHWSYEYNRGAFHEYVGAREWHWQEDASDTEWLLTTEAVDIAIEVLKKELGYD